MPNRYLGLAFPNDTGNIEGLPNIQRRVWDPLQVKCGLVDTEGVARYRFHSLRHAAAWLFIAHLVGRQSGCRRYSVTHQ